MCNNEKTYNTNKSKSNNCKGTLTFHSAFTHNLVERRGNACHNTSKKYPALSCSPDRFNKSSLTRVRFCQPFISTNVAYFLCQTAFLQLLLTNNFATTLARKLQTCFHCSASLIFMSSSPLILSRSTCDEVFLLSFNVNCSNTI